MPPPFNQHPIPSMMRRVLAAGSTLVASAESEVDVLLVPPPPNTKVARETVFEILLTNNTGVDIPAADPDEFNFRLVYKTADREIFVPTSLDAEALPAGFIKAMNLDQQFLMEPTDRGLFLRITAENVVGVSALASYYDVRDLNRVAVTLTQSDQDLLAGEEGVVKIIAPGGEEGEHIFLSVLNFDTDEHEIRVSMSNGVDTVFLFEAEVEGGLLMELLQESPIALPPIIIPEGWALRARLSEAIVDAPCIVLVGYSKTNVAPAEQQDGGAF